MYLTLIEELSSPFDSDDESQMTVSFSQLIMLVLLTEFILSKTSKSRCDVIASDWSNSNLVYSI